MVLEKTGAEKGNELLTERYLIFSEIRKSKLFRFTEIIIRIAKANNKNKQQQNKVPCCTEGSEGHSNRYLETTAHFFASQCWCINSVTLIHERDFPQRQIPRYTVCNLSSKQLMGSYLDTLENQYVHLQPFITPLFSFVCIYVCACVQLCVNEEVSVKCGQSETLKYLQTRIWVDITVDIIHSNIETHWQGCIFNIGGSYLCCIPLCSLVAAPIKSQTNIFLCMSCYYIKCKTLG